MKRLLHNLKRLPMLLLFAVCSSLADWADASLAASCTCPNCTAARQVKGMIDRNILDLHGKPITFKFPAIVFRGSKIGAN